MTPSTPPRESPRPRRRGRRIIERAETLLTVLVADDEELIRLALSRLLSARGHTVHTAADAPEALALLDLHAFDVVLVDRRMPGDGATVLEALESRPDFTGRAVLMTGAVGAEATGELGPDVRLVTKPFDFSSMVAVVEGPAG